MANIKELKQKVISLKNMQKVMRAMNMIASIKLRKLLGKQEHLRLFDKSLNIIIKKIIDNFKGNEHPVLSGHKKKSKTGIVIFSADKGLCGAHNNNILKAAEKLIKDKNLDKNNIEFTAIGVKAAHYCRRREYKMHMKTEISERILNSEKLNSIVESLLKRFTENQSGEVFLIYNKFISTISSETIVMRLLPITAPDLGQAPEAKGRRAVQNEKMETEPGYPEFITESAALYVFYRLKTALLNSGLSEHSSRMTAMENATNNSEDLIHRYNKTLNRKRQADITSELIEIISGKEALKG